MLKIRDQRERLRSHYLELGQVAPGSGPPCTCPLPEAGIVTDQELEGPLISEGPGSLALESGLTGGVIRGLEWVSDPNYCFPPSRHYRQWRQPEY